MWKIKYCGGTPLPWAVLRFAGGYMQEWVVVARLDSRLFADRLITCSMIPGDSLAED